MIRRLVPFLLLAAACTPAPPATTTDASPVFVADSMVGVRTAPAETPVAMGDCAEALRRAAAKPDLVVDKIPAPIVSRPAPLQRVPRTALRRDGSADVKVDVLIDTLGVPVMNTFTVVSASSKWLVTNVKTVLPKWKFAPAELAGCKVPRIYHFMASAPARKKDL